MNETYYYFFDCLDGVLSEKYFTPEELFEIQHGAPGSMTEKEIIKTAANYEATLYRYTKNTAGEFTNETILYDCTY